MKLIFSAEKKMGLIEMRRKRRQTKMEVLRTK
jgi:hypothetical protein